MQFCAQTYSLGISKTYSGPCIYDAQPRTHWLHSPRWTPQTEIFPSLTLLLGSICHWSTAPWSTQKFKSKSHISLSLSYSLCPHHALSHCEPASFEVSILFLFSISTPVTRILALSKSHPVKCKSRSSLIQTHFPIYLTHCGRKSNCIHSPIVSIQQLSLLFGTMAIRAPPTCFLSVCCASLHHSSSDKSLPFIQSCLQLQSSVLLHMLLLPGMSLSMHPPIYGFINQVSVVYLLWGSTVLGMGEPATI